MVRQLYYIVFVSNTFYTFPVFNQMLLSMQQDISNARYKQFTSCQVQQWPIPLTTYPNLHCSEYVVTMSLVYF
jgi:hypothetical protein